jgi:FtsP/CotA-like multicopper oxidase with cupredoxin domain
MTRTLQRMMTRRNFLLTGTGLAATGGLTACGLTSGPGAGRPGSGRAATANTAATAATAATEYRLVAAPAAASLVGDGHPATAVWSYNGSIPGPVLRVKQATPLRVLLENRLPGVTTTIHWHGIRLPIAMDGVPGISQPPVADGERFVYEFTPPDAGTYWYHPHSHSLEQIGRGLSGVLIVEEREPVAVDRDLLWVLGDWRLRADAQIDGGFGHPRDAAMAGRIGNTVTVNGRIPDAEPVRAGERVRLRLVNVSLARMMALRFGGHEPVIIAIDGQPCEPHGAPDGRVVIGPAMRVDVLLDMHGAPGARYAVTDDFYERRAYRLLDIAYSEAPRLRERMPPAIELPANPHAQPDLASAERIVVRLQGGMHGSMRMGGATMWAINDHAMHGDGHAGMVPMRTLRLGRSYRLVFINETAFPHPMHLHGHSVLLVARDGAPVPHRQWADTVMVGRRETVEVAFVADNPGDWMLHCHVTDHQVTGLMTVLRVA